ncbi:MAG: 3-hydroxyanthranilate 3,4-dioxygenase [Gammaproteobacteria bacterium]|nr:3-hydroxyanthranilate 3,4-dioxygenase [Gammaproteobacteria bacterium]
MKPLPPFNFQQWIDAHRDLLKPPVCNQQVFADGEFIVMVVGGPNSRSDFHYDVGPEFFYQLEGDMILHTMQDNQRVDYPLSAGDIFMLPPGIPHSPRRFENSVGLVIERQRKPHEKDGFMWFCENCDALLYEEYLHIANIVDDLPPVFDRFYGNEEFRHCGNCHTVMAVPGT